MFECPGLRGHPNGPQPSSQPTQATSNGIGSANGYPATPNGAGHASGAGTAAGAGATSLSTANGAAIISNGINPHAGTLQTPLQSLPGRPSLSTPGPSTVSGSSTASGQVQSRATPKAKNKVSNSTLPAPPLDDVHAAFVEFRAKEEDKVSYDIHLFFFGHF